MYSLKIINWWKICSIFYIIQVLHFEWLLVFFFLINWTNINTKVEKHWWNSSENQMKINWKSTENRVHSLCSGVFHVKNWRWSTHLHRMIPSTDIFQWNSDEILPMKIHFERENKINKQLNFKGTHSEKNIIHSHRITIKLYHFFLMTCNKSDIQTIFIDFGSVFIGCIIFMRSKNLCKLLTIEKY